MGVLRRQILKFVEAEEAPFDASVKSSSRFSCAHNDAAARSWAMGSPMSTDRPALRDERLEGPAVARPFRFVFRHFCFQRFLGLLRLVGAPSQRGHLGAARRRRPPRLFELDISRCNRAAWRREVVS